MVYIFVLAISYECIRTVSGIYPNSVLIDNAAKTISRFVTASNNNWKYLGITALASLVLINPKYAADYQGVVMDCLEDPDETIKRKVSRCEVKEDFMTLSYVWRPSNFQFKICLFPFYIRTNSI